MKRIIELDCMQVMVDFGRHSAERLFERNVYPEEVLLLLTKAEDKILDCKVGEKFLVENGVIGFIGSLDIDPIDYTIIIDGITVIRSNGREMHFSKELKHIPVPIAI